MNFDFNFTDGGFTDGTFKFESEGDVHGFISGTIDRVFVVGVPEPSTYSLLLLGSPLVMLRKRKRGKVCI
jgi:hypothetical protein